MLTLASMAWAAFMFVATQTGMLHDVPPPMIIETGTKYSYNEIEDALYVPANWTDTCDNQSRVVYYMVRSFNNFRNGKNKLTENKMQEITKKWVCVDDQQ